MSIFGNWDHIEITTAHFNVPLVVLPLIYLSNLLCLAPNLYDGHVMDWEIQLLIDLQVLTASSIVICSP